MPSPLDALAAILQQFGFGGTGRRPGEQFSLTPSYDQTIDGHRWRLTHRGRHDATDVSLRWTDAPVGFVTERELGRLPPSGRVDLEQIADVQTLATVRAEVRWADSEGVRRSTTVVSRRSW